MPNFFRGTFTGSEQKSVFLNKFCDNLIDIWTVWKINGLSIIFNLLIKNQCANHQLLKKSMFYDFQLNKKIIENMYKTSK